MSLKENINLVDINLSKNNFDNEFAKELAKSLKVNETLYKCEIHSNPIGEEGAMTLLTMLHEDNETLESFGNITAYILYIIIFFFN